MHSDLFDQTGTNYRMFGDGDFCYTGPKAGHYFRVAFSTWVTCIQDIRECMAQGHSEHDTTTSVHATRGSGESHAHTRAGCLHACMGSTVAVIIMSCFSLDNQNVMFGVQKSGGTYM